MLQSPSVKPKHGYGSRSKRAGYHQLCAHSGRTCRAQALPNEQVQGVSTQEVASPDRMNGAWPQSNGQASANIQPPFNVVITGGSKGVGYALARGFLAEGDTVLICSRDQDRLDESVTALAKEFGAGRVYSVRCDVSVPADVDRLAQAAREKLGRIDLWINNAGSNAYKAGPLAEFDAQDIIDVVQTNVLGVMLCCQAAINVIREQGSPGHIFTMDGAGSNGSATPRYAAYGASKRGLSQLRESLQAELKLLNVSNVGIHNMSPGMVTTELLMSGANTPTAKWFINCLAEPAEVVAAYLVPRVRKVPQEASTLTGGISQGSYVRFLTPWGAFQRIASRAVLGKNKSRFVPED